MVENNSEGPVSGIKLSSVVPAKVTGDNREFELSSMDLAMKLHYIRGVYLFKSEAVKGLTIYELKEPTFKWLEFYYTISGRIRRSESGRPYIRCNDSGVRIVEAVCENSMDEWLDLYSHGSGDHYLVHDQVLGPDLGFSPLVFIQFTFFKCGGTSIGLSWAHVIGDIFSASAVLNTLGQIMAGNTPSKPPRVPNLEKYSTTVPKKAPSIAKVYPVGDHWITSPNPKMATHTFHISPNQLNHIGLDEKTSPFEIISAMIWKSLSKLSKDSGPKSITVCENDSGDRVNQTPTNSATFRSVEPDFSVAKCGVGELAKFIAEKSVIENGIIEEAIGKDGDNSDFVVYGGANPTFVNSEGLDLYGLELNKQKPVYANYSIHGVGDGGVVLVLPTKDGGNNGRNVTMVFPEDVLTKLKNELKIVYGL